MDGKTAFESMARQRRPLLSWLHPQPCKTEKEYHEPFLPSGLTADMKRKTCGVGGEGSHTLNHGAVGRGGAGRRHLVKVQNRGEFWAEPWHLANDKMDDEMVLNNKLRFADPIKLFYL